MLRNPRHEQFAQLVANGENHTQAYLQAGYAENGAAQSAARLMRDGRIQERIEEIRTEITAKMIDVSIRDQNSRLAAAQERWVLMQELVMKSLRGQGIMLDAALLREIRALEEHAAKEMVGWAEKHEHSGPGGGPIAIADARLTQLTDEELTVFHNLLRKVQPEPE